MKRQNIKFGLIFIGLAAIFSLMLFYANQLFSFNSFNESNEPVITNTFVPAPTEEGKVFIPLLTEKDPTFAFSKAKTIPTVTIPYFTKENFENNEEIYLKIPKIGVDSKLGMACGSHENDYDFSELDELPLWICPNDGPYLSSLGLVGTSIILGHRQWGPSPKIFAELDKIELGDEVIVSSSSIVLTYKTIETIEVKPEDLWQKISEINIQGKENSHLILVTCTPYGTNWRRLLIITTLEKGEWK